MKVLSRLFRGLFLAKLRSTHQAYRLKFFGGHAHLDDARAFKAYPAPLRNIEWVVYAKRPFGGPQAVLAYLSRYTHRVAISNHRLISADGIGVTFKWKDYRIEGAYRLQNHVARYPRVHSPLPQPRTAKRLPSHPPLRPARQRQPCR